MAGKKWVDFSMDEGETGIVNGYIKGIADNISTRRYVDGAVEFATQQLSRKFEEEADIAAASNEGREHFYHVYNWGDTYGDRSLVGSPANRLWKLVSVGQGKNRAIGFTFLPETRPSPIEPELLELGVNPGVHIFTWKAPVMEYGIPVNIRPKLPGVKGMSFVKDGVVYYRQGEVNTTPGYKTTTGVFSSFFVTWWSQVAPGEYERNVKPMLEADVIRPGDLSKIAKQATRRRRKDLGINVLDEKTGERLAKKHMDDNRIDYVRRARRRRMKLYGY